MKAIIYLLCCFLIIVSCRPAKKVQRIEQAISKKDTNTVVVVDPTGTDSLSVIRSVISNITKPRVNFHTFSAKVKVEYQGKDGGDQATAFIRMQKDSLIWLSLTGAFGIEGFRVLIDKDSVKLMNKLKKVVQYRSINYLKEISKVPLDFYHLQDLIVGNPIYVDSNIVSYKHTQNELLVLMVGNVFKNLLTLQSNDLRVLHSKLDDVDPARNRTADITFDNYESVNDFIFSTSRKISIAEKSRLDIGLDFKQYAFDQPQSFPFNIPKNYKTQ